MHNNLFIVAWVIMAEIMHTRLRSKAFGLFVSINWGFNLLIGMLTLTAIEGLGGTTSDMDDDEVIEIFLKLFFHNFIF
jgi:hypothetical protein